MTTALAEKTCTPCRGGIPPLTPEEAESFRTQAPEWKLLDDATRIERTYRFVNFREAFAFVAKAAELAETEGHHPDISFGGATRRFRCAPRRSRACTRTISSWPRSWIGWREKERGCRL
jgi:pterin-4a-carbinolamine dehydratase